MNRIDTTAPVITGTTFGGNTITSGGTYSTGITLSFSDAHLSGAVLSGINGSAYFSGNFQNNKTISATGTYILTVRDLAGNTSSILFRIKEYVFCESVNDVPQSECAALVDLYSGTNGSGWTYTGGWLVNTNVCSWYGVSCNTGHVGGLNLWNNSLS